ncbi:MAG: hypothetical protein V4773_25845 [Verrucomicrobiota bacterium]
MSGARANLPINLKLLPSLGDHFSKRALAYGMTTSGLLAAAVWNDHLKPDRKLVALEAPRKLKRVEDSVTLRLPLKRLAKARARAQGLSLNAYVEALIAAHLARPLAPLVVLHADQKK